MSSKPEEMREEFVMQEANYKAFAGCLEQLIVTLLRGSRITIHSITHRVKGKESLYEKLKRPGKNYSYLSDITDLAGLRIITYLPEDVDKVAELIESEFAIDRINSIDKRLVNDPDRFGYASLHKVCSLSEQRLSLAEYSSYRDLKCEIQIKTILQHAWAEIEHDLGYKSVAGVPTHFRRRFSRLAALLEAADEEFMRLKNDLTAYSRDIRDKVASSAPGVPLDKVTLGLFIQTSDLLKSIEQTTIWPNQAELVPVSSEVLDQYVEHFKQLGITHIDSLAGAFNRHREHIAKGASRCQEVDYGPEYCQTPTEQAWSLWMLIQLLCAERHTLADTLEAFKKVELWIADSPEAYADSLRAIVRDTQQHEGELKAKDWKTVYVTVTEEGGSGNSFPLALHGEKWVWENVTVTDDHVLVDGKRYLIESKDPLWATFVHKGRSFSITW